MILRGRTQLSNSVSDFISLIPTWLHLFSLGRLQSASSTARFKPTFSCSLTNHPQIIQRGWTSTVKQPACFRERWVYNTAKHPESAMSLSGVQKMVLAGPSRSPANYEKHMNKPFLPVPHQTPIKSRAPRPNRENKRQGHQFHLRLCDREVPVWLSGLC